MTARRRLLAAASATFALTALAACEKPAPLVTLVSGGESVYTEAATYCFEEGQELDSGECVTRHEGVTQLSVRGGDKVGVDVGEEVVERGWQLELSDPQDPRSVQTSPPLDDHYFTFTAPNLPPGGRLLLTVRALSGQDGAGQEGAGQGQEGQPGTGEWVFELVAR
jgi:hypothetical protein